MNTGNPGIACMNELLNDVLSDPSDDAARLVYADWLDEMGDPRGRFIRIQCEIEKRGRFNRDDEIVCDLIAEELEIVDEYQEIWAAPFEDFTRKCVFNRGMIELVIMSAHDFLQHGSKLFEREPVQLVQLHDLDHLSVVKDLAECDSLLRLKGLSLSWAASHDANQFLKSSRLANIERLILAHCGTDSSTAVAIAQSKYLARLKYLDLSHNWIRNQGVTALAKSENVQNLEVLLLNGNEVRLLGAKALAASNYLNELKYLNVSNNKIPNAGIGILRSRFGRTAVEG